MKGFGDIFRNLDLFFTFETKEEEIHRVLS